MKKLLLLLALALALLLTGCKDKKPENVTPIENFKLTEYLGTWYEIARLEHRFEKGMEAIIAHGSRKESSNAEVIRLGERVKTLVDTQYDIVKTAFLEFADPSLEESIKACVKEGVNKIIILPYFLAPGKHVAFDIPAIAEQMRSIYPEVKIVLKEHLGSMEGMASFLGSMALQSVNNRDDNDIESMVMKE